MWNYSNTTDTCISTVRLRYLVKSTFPKFSIVAQNRGQRSFCHLVQTANCGVILCNGLESRKKSSPFSLMSPWGSLLWTRRCGGRLSSVSMQVCNHNNQTWKMDSRWFNVSLVRSKRILVSMQVCKHNNQTCKMDSRCFNFSSVRSKRILVLSFPGGRRSVLLALSLGPFGIVGHFQGLPIDGRNSYSRHYCHNQSVFYTSIRNTPHLEFAISWITKKIYYS